MGNFINEIFKATAKSYENILSRYYPSHGSNGFTERNLTFNFSHNYLTGNPEAIIWQECPLKEKGHFDTLIIDENKKSVIVIEAKRLQSDGKKESIEADSKRIKEKYHEINGIEKYAGYQKYALLLVDAWVSKERVEKDNRHKLLHEFASAESISEIKINFDCSERYYLAYKLQEI